MSQIYRIVVSPKPEFLGKGGERLVGAAKQIGVDGVTQCQANKLFFVSGEATESQIEQLSKELLADPITESVTIEQIGEGDPEAEPNGDANELPTSFFVDVLPLPGVTDPPAENLIRAAKQLEITLERAATGQRFQIESEQPIPLASADKLANLLLSNPVIQQTSINRALHPPFVPYTESDGLVETIELTEAGADELLEISQTRRLSLNLAEMEAIQSWYRSEGREPTDVELEMLAQTWSEHCVHKTFKATINYTDETGQQERIEGILNQYIRAATEAIDKPWVKSAFVDNAGIVAFDDNFDLAFKVETHNHPSALEPFGGANTGIGGVVRDILGVSARPIANTDVLCFGPQEMDADDLPEGVLHPTRVKTGVIAGIEDYGNKMGIPTVNGSIFYHPGYLANPLVYCGSLGILPIGSHPTEPQIGDLIVAIGGRTGRDGLRGATFSSMEMDVSTSEIAGTAVQIGHPIMEKQVQEVILKARDANLYTAITDCGAGGFSSAVGEMSEKLGAQIQLSNIQLKYPGLRPWEIWLSEAQERMVLAVPQQKMELLQAICAEQDVEATVLGEFTGDGRLQIFYGERLVGDLAESFLHDGLPERVMTAEWRGGKTTYPQSLRQISHEKALLELLAHPNISSKEETIRVYDHEVQGGTAVKPLVGQTASGPSDAAVIVPLDHQIRHPDPHSGPVKGVAISNGICPQFAEIDPYKMAWAAIDEAIRNGVAVGADPDEMAILDNFCWGNPNLPDRLGALVRCSQGCYDAAVAYGTPFISGKDSLNNEYTGEDGQKHAIPGTLLVSAIGPVPDVKQAITMDFKAHGEVIYMLGTTGKHMVGSHYAEIVGSRPDWEAMPEPKNSLDLYRRLHQGIRIGLVSACHDCSEGGLAVALAEMGLAGGLGADIDLDALLTEADLLPAEQLFSESMGRLIVTVPVQAASAFEALFEGQALADIGTVLDQPKLMIQAQNESVIEIEIEALAEAFLPEGHQPSTWSSENRIEAETSEGQGSYAPQVLTSKPQVLILHANGSNRDRDAALACQLAGGEATIVHLNRLLKGEISMSNFHMLVLPGGFSYGDDLGAGVLWASDMRYRLKEELTSFVADERPVLGICNGFQVLVKTGILEGEISPQRETTLTYNNNGHFECRWVELLPNQSSPSIFLDGLESPIICPVAHGEGRFIPTNLETLSAANMIALTYRNGESSYPDNPNGSIAGIAGISNAAGNVLGLMPHPEDHVFPWQHPRFHREDSGHAGLVLFKNGLRYAAK